jgi:hypothetical protein
LKKLVLSLALLLLVFSLDSSAEILFDSAIGEGFVAGEKVKAIFSWEDSQFYLFATAVTFTYITEHIYTAQCVNELGTENHQSTITRIRTIDSVVATNSRIASSPLGFALLGFTAGVNVLGRNPEISDECRGIGRTSGITALVDLTGYSSRLVVTHRGVTKKVWP